MQGTEGRTGSSLVAFLQPETGACGRETAGKVRVTEQGNSRPNTGSKRGGGQGSEGAGDRALRGHTPGRGDIKAAKETRTQTWRGRG